MQFHAFLKKNNKLLLKTLENSPMLSKNPTFCREIEYGTTTLVLFAVVEG